MGGQGGAGGGGMSPAGMTGGGASYGNPNNPNQYTGWGTMPNVGAMLGGVTRPMQSAIGTPAMGGYQGQPNPLYAGNPMAGGAAGGMINPMQSLNIGGPKSNVAFPQGGQQGVGTPSPAQQNQINAWSQPQQGLKPGLPNLNQPGLFNNAQQLPQGNVAPWVGNAGMAMPPGMGGQGPGIAMQTNMIAPPPVNNFKPWTGGNAMLPSMGAQGNAMSPMQNQFGPGGATPNPALQKALANWGGPASGQPNPMTLMQGGPTGGNPMMSGGMGPGTTQQQTQQPFPGSTTNAGIQTPLNPTSGGKTQK